MCDRARCPCCSPFLLTALIADEIFGLAGFRDVQHNSGLLDDQLIIPRNVRINVITSHTRGRMLMPVVCVEDQHTVESIAHTASWRIRKVPRSCDHRE